MIGMFSPQLYLQCDMESGMYNKRIKHIWATENPHEIQVVKMFGVACWPISLLDQ